MMKVAPGPGGLVGLESPVWGQEGGVEGSRKTKLTNSLMALLNTVLKVYRKVWKDLRKTEHTKAAASIKSRKHSYTERKNENITGSAVNNICHAITLYNIGCWFNKKKMWCWERRIRRRSVSGAVLFTEKPKLTGNVKKAKVLNSLIV